MNVKHLQTLVVCCSSMTVLHKLLKIHTFWNTPHSFNGFSLLKRLRGNKRNSGLFHSLFFTSATFTVGKVQSLLDMAEH